MSRQRRIFWPGAGIVLAAPLLLMIDLIVCAGLSGCASTNAVAAANTLEQKAYAIYGTFVIVEEQGASLAAAPGTSATVRGAIRAADAKAKPTADTLVTLLHQYETASAAMKAGNGTAAQLSVAESQLGTWISQATTDVNTLISAVKGPTP